MWAGTNLDYETGEVSDVYGPFKTHEEAIARIKAHAESEFEEIQEEDSNAELNDMLDEDGTIEVLFGEDNGCLYQVFEMQP